MTDRSTLEQQAAVATIQRRRPISLVWIVPLAALLIGGWLAVKAIREKGPTITITFATAEGLEAGKTKIRFKEVEIGQVEQITLSEDADRVKVTAKMVKGSEPYLTDQSKFWVVRPRISGGSVSGLGTVFSGAYIGIDASRAGTPTYDFTGLEEPPVVTISQPGRHFTLKADALGSIDAGAPIYYRQIKVGQVVSYGFASDARTVEIKIFIEAPYHSQVTENTRFWNASGIDVSLNAQGLKVDTQSMVSILTGGIAFEVPRDTPPGREAEANAEFSLYADRNSIQEKQYRIRNYWLLLFDESVRGLNVGAPVELFGIKIGEVVDLRLQFNADSKKFIVPVTVAFEPERIESAQQLEALQKAEKEPGYYMKALVEEQGLRAQLQSANLLTGQMMINLIFAPDSPRATLEMRDGLRIIPTIPGSFQRIQEGLTRIVANLEKVRFDQLGSEAEKTIVETRTTLKRIGDLAGRLDRETAPRLQKTMAELEKTLVELQGTLGKDAPLTYNARKAMEEMTRSLRAIRDLADTLENRPQSIIFGKEKENP